MQLTRERWNPLTVVIETKEEAEILHKILALVTDDTEGLDCLFLSSLFTELGKGLGDSSYRVAGTLTVKDYKEF